MRLQIPVDLSVIAAELKLGWRQGLQPAPVTENF
jgi:hypothetical protein